MNPFAVMVFIHSNVPLLLLLLPKAEGRTLMPLGSTALGETYCVLRKKSGPRGGEAREQSEERGVEVKVE